MGTFRASARIFPTEDPLMVSRTITNLFPEAVVSVSDDKVSATIPVINNLAKLLLDQKTRYAFLDALREACDDNHFSLRLNKQAASVSRVNIVDEPKPLGWLEFSGEVEDPVSYFEKMLDAVGYITARTDGHVAARETAYKSQGG